MVMGDVSSSSCAVRFLGVFSLVIPEWFVDVLSRVQPEQQSTSVLTLKECTRHIR